MSFIRHIVSHGETVWDIAREHLISQNRDASPIAVDNFVAEITKNSPDIKDPNKIRPDQILYLTTFETLDDSNPIKSSSTQVSDNTPSSANRFRASSTSTNSGIPTRPKATVSSAGGSSDRQTTKDDYLNKLEDSLNLYSPSYQDFDTLIEEGLKKGYIPNTETADKIEDLRRERTLETLKKANDPKDDLYKDFKKMCALAVELGVISDEEAFDLRLDRVANTLEYASYPENDLYKDFNKIVDHYSQEGFLDDELAIEAFQMRNAHTKESLEKAANPEYRLYVQFDDILEKAEKAGVIHDSEVASYKKQRTQKTEAFIKELPNRLKDLAIKGEHKEIRRLYTCVIRAKISLETNYLMKFKDEQTDSNHKLSELFELASKTAMINGPDQLINDAADEILYGNRERAQEILDLLLHHEKIDQKTYDSFLNKTAPAEPQYIEEGPEIITIEK